jgi:hypothetical protein
VANNFLPDQRLNNQAEAVLVSDGLSSQDTRLFIPGRIQ